jgi:hypothetical protein
MAIGFDYFESNQQSSPEFRRWSIEHRLGEGPFSLEELHTVIGDMVLEATSFEPPVVINPEDIILAVYGTDEVKLVYGDHTRPPVKVTPRYTIHSDRNAFSEPSHNSGNRQFTHPGSVVVSVGTFEAQQEKERHENKRYKSDTAKTIAQLKINDRHALHLQNRDWWFNNYDIRNQF